MFHLKMIEYRKKNMMTQEELADRLGVSRQTITRERFCRVWNI